MYLSVKEPKIIKTHLKVTKVVDGDGLIVSNLFNKEEEEVRLLGIDAPELRICGKLNQDERETHIAGQLLMMMGRMAQRFMTKAAPPETNITIVQEIKNLKDTYGRTLAYVYLPDGNCLNEMMVAAGYAKPYGLVYCSQLKTYQELNRIARMKRLGLYSLVNRF